ncbi:MAG: hypothetical protein IJ226_04110 [Clostridia bacterium]|nr:hypothetical protein [Clostridia bacterium]
MESNTKKTLKKMTVGWVLVPAAIFVFIVAIGLICSLPKHSAKTTAIISSISTYHNSKGEKKRKVYVDYDVDGESYNHVYLNEYSSDFYEGKEITLLYNAEDPTEIATTTRQITSYVMFGFGGVLLTIGVANFAIELAKIKDREPVDTVLENEDPFDK